MVHPAAFHPLTPGNPAYAVLKVTAIGSLVGLRFVFARRSKNQGEGGDAAAEPETVPAPAERQRAPHPVSRKKRRRRRR